MPRIPAIVTAAVRLLSVVAVCALPAMAEQRPRPERPDRPARPPRPERPERPERNRGARPGKGLIQQRTYLFNDTKEMLPYGLFVSSKVGSSGKAPLIIALHRMNSEPETILRGPLLKLAEEGGYIVAAPMGYNPHGWYGAPIFRSARAQSDPGNLQELSEKDVMNVLDLVRGEFPVDENRVYLLGHSMGGAGAFHLAVKYPKTWAAMAAIAPASFDLKPSSLAAIPDMPMIVVQGDADGSVPVTMTRTWVDYMKDHKMTHRYLEVPGGDHGSVIPATMPDVFAFFGEHVRSGRR